MEVEEVQAHHQHIQQQNEQGNTRSSTISTNRLKDWHHSRIIRVSRASGGKDRHSKVMTSKGLRDRRVRLSVSTAIQFYDLQDRLGYDQPSKAVQWLINAAADAIAKLPSLDAVYTSPKQQQVSYNEKRGSSDNGFENCGEMNNQLPLLKSACSSNSETSRGSGLSLVRHPDVKVNRAKARERARERAAKEKESSNNYNHADECGIAQQQPSSQNGSFTELLAAGFGHNNAQQSSQHQHQNISFERVLFHKPAARPQQQMDYNQLQFSLPSQTMFSISGDHHHHHHRSSQPEMQHFSDVPDYIPVSAATANSDHYNLNFSMSSSSGSGGLAGFNGGTLQSKSTAPTSASLLSPHHHFQRFAPMESNNNVPFFLGGALASTPTMENHQHQHHSQFPFGLQLYGDGSHRHSDHKGKANN